MSSVRSEPVSNLTAVRYPGGEPGSCPTRWWAGLHLARARPHPDAAARGLGSDDGRHQTVLILTRGDFISGAAPMPILDQSRSITSGLVTSALGSRACPLPAEPVLRLRSSHRTVQSFGLAPKLGLLPELAPPCKGLILGCTASTTEARFPAGHRRPAGRRGHPGRALPHGSVGRLRGIRRC